MVGILSDFSTTDASNTAFAGNSVNINVMKPSDARKFAQAIGGAQARWLADVGAVNTVGGTGDAITVTLSQPYTAYGTSTGQIPTGALIRFQAGAANTTAVTLNVNSIGTKAIRKTSGGTDVALVAGDIVAGETYTLIYRSSANSAAGAWVMIGAAAIAAASTSTSGIVQLATTADALGATNATKSLVPSALAQERTLGAQSVNYGLTASVNANALTVNLVGADGNTPSGSDPVTILFRNATLTTGTPVARTVTSAASLVVASTKTLGTSNSTAFRLWIVAVDTGSGIEVGVVNALSGTSIMALRPGIYSPTATPGNSAQVVYTTSGQTSKPIAIIGWMEWASGLATAGTWASGPTTIKLWQPGDPLPNDMIQVAQNTTGALATGTTTISGNNTTPQNTAGDQYMSQSITPSSASNLLKVTHVGEYGNSSSSSVVGVFLFQDSNANAIASQFTALPANQAGNATVTARLLAKTAGIATTFKIRAGGSVASTTTFNGQNATAFFNGTIASYLEAQEIMA